MIRVANPLRRSLFGTVRGFLASLRALPPAWVAWVAFLGALNVLGGLFFFESVEGQLVLTAMAVAFILMLAIFRQYGFVRLLGLGHIVVWVPLLPWLWFRLGTIGTGSLLGMWVLAVIAADGISLTIDVVDVVRYWRGERTPTVAAEDFR